MGPKLFSSRDSWVETGKNQICGWVQWLMAIIPATWESEIGGLQLEANLGKKKKKTQEGH
jgi:hypothetical protein